MTTELSRPAAIRRIGPRETDVVVEASAAECAALARRLGLPAIAAFRCDFRLRALPAGVFAARLRLRAVLTQICVVTLEPFAAVVTEETDLRFVPAGRESDDPDPEAIDEIPYAGEAFDLGEVAAEQLALALDPYPRKPDPGGSRTAPAADQAPDATVGKPFSGLAGRLRPH